MNYKMILAAVVAVVCVSGLYASKQTKKSTVNPNFVATFAQNQQNTQSSQSQSFANPNRMLFQCPFSSEVKEEKTVAEFVTVITGYNENVMPGCPTTYTPVNQLVLSGVMEKISFVEDLQNGSSSSSQQQVQQPQQNNLNIQNNGLNTQSTQQPQQNRQRRLVLPTMQLDFNGGPNGFGVFNKK